MTWPTSRTAMPRVLAAWIRRGRDLADLADVAGRPLDLGAGDGLHRVDDDEVGLDRLDLAQHRGEIGLGGEEQRGGHRLDALGPHPDLGGRLLAADVEDVLAAAGGGAATSSSSVDLPIPGSPATRTTEPGTRPPPRTRSSSPTPVPRGRGVVDVDLGDAQRRAADRRGGGGADGRHADLGDRAPGLALAAPADPLDGGPAALGTAEPARPCRRPGCHAADGRRAHRHRSGGAPLRLGRPARPRAVGAG